MASFLRRRRSFLIKLLLLVPVLYLLALAVFSMGGRRMEIPSAPGGDGWHEPARGHDARDLQGVHRENLAPPPPPDNQAAPAVQQQRVHEPVVAQPVHADSLKVDAKEVNIPNPINVQVQHEPPKREEPAVVAKSNDKVTEVQRLDPSAPGENGKAVSIAKEKLTEEERKKFDEGWKNNAYNQYASDMISLHRSLPDTRDKE
ncbi:polypeptide N-acetylgalactosaminyltransferase [Elysia marginata]|uniref:Polypeptide N-acetylgalactosaminyltransferase n=1 Tax=Elysia marginata TaxID=1093978 RepID=A0AAV4IMJ0_9GAST|nr:polypeptide N-acetylgalactosaminyltransferase [Elysia marginata]